MLHVIKLIGIIIFSTAVLLFIASVETEHYSASNFVGRWESSKIATSIYLYPNGEWEVLGTDGAVLQYGLWQYKKNMIVWSNKVGSKIERVASPVVSVSQQEFQVRDSATTTVTFRRYKQEG